MTERLRILQVNTADHGGGAERIALELHQSYARAGHAAWLAVGRKRTDRPRVLEIPHGQSDSTWTRWCERTAARLDRGLKPAAAILRRIARPRRWLHTLTGRDDFNHPASQRLLELAGETPDVLQLHNLHGDYFDLRLLPALSARLPVVVTTHDAWLFTGHCAHGITCERWRHGCGQCPDLTIPPAIRRDATAANWRRKQAIYARSRLFVATPSEWLMRQVHDSMLAPAILDSRVIPNGVDLQTFTPGDGRALRHSLGIAPDARVVLAVANSLRTNPFKDFDTLRKAAVLLGQRPQGPDIVIVLLGDRAPSEAFGRVTLRGAPVETEPARVADYYRMADVYVHAARVDTFPNTVLEALACGRPVVASAVGGIVEQVQPLDSISVAGRPHIASTRPTGILVHPQDPAELARAIERLLDDPALLARLAENAAADARSRFSLERQCATYLDWFHSILDRRHGAAERPAPVPVPTASVL